MSSLTQPHFLTLLYLSLGIVVAIGIWIQSAMLKKNDGKYPNSSIFSALSALDTLWVLVSFLAFFWLDFSGSAKLIAAFHIIYAVMSFFYAGISINSDSNSAPTRLEDIVFSKKYLDFSQSFALIFILASTLMIGSLVNLIYLPFL